MKITDARVIITSPGRNFVTLKLTTEDGVYGLGDATVNGRELSVASYLTDHVIPCLIGRDARQIEDIWQFLYKGAYWRRGPVTMAAIAAVDTALWDIKGKALNTPVYDLLGGRSREAVMVYGHANGRDIERHGEGRRPLCGDGLQGHPRAERRPRALGHVRRRQGRDAIRAGGEGPAVRDAPGAREKYLNFVPTLFERLREEFGDEVHLLHDVHHR